MGPKGLVGQRTTLYNAIIIDMSLYTSSKPKECTTPSVAPKVQRGFWVITRCPVHSLTVTHTPV